MGTPAPGKERVRLAGAQGSRDPARGGGGNLVTRGSVSQLSGPLAVPGASQTKSDGVGQAIDPGVFTGGSTVGPATKRTGHTP